MTMSRSEILGVVAENLSTQAEEKGARAAVYYPLTEQTVSRARKPLWWQTAGNWRKIYGIRNATVTFW